jgi:hypothetical protein
MVMQKNTKQKYVKALGRAVLNLLCAAVTLLRLCALKAFVTRMGTSNQS